MRKACEAPEVEARRAKGVADSWTPERIERDRQVMKSKRALVSSQSCSDGSEVVLDVDDSGAACRSY